MNPYPVPIGLVGCGNISATYLSVIAELPQIEVMACADLRVEAAQQIAERFSIPRVLDVDELHLKRMGRWVWRL